MATQICPKCKKDSFTWRMDNEVSDVTIWSCFNCSYEALEDESKVTKCNLCRDTRSQLKDENELYWWCFNCKKRII
jgi:hypothetical protein